MRHAAPALMVLLAARDGEEAATHRVFFMCVVGLDERGGKVGRSGRVEHQEQSVIRLFSHIWPPQGAMESPTIVLIRDCASRRSVVSALSIH